jgi:hypothetical protein
LAIDGLSKQVVLKGAVARLEIGKQQPFLSCMVRQRQMPLHDGFRRRHKTDLLFFSSLLFSSYVSRQENFRCEAGCNTAKLFAFH